VQNIPKTTSIARLVTLTLVMSFLLSCGPVPAPGVAVKIRFAQSRQAETDPRGLPLGIHSFKVQAFAVSLSGSLQGDSGCIDIDADDSRRKSLTMDLIPQQNLVVVASGYAGQGCLGGAEPEWMGLTKGIEVIVGREVQVPVYVTRRGMALNNILDELRPGRAFASANELPDGKILVAGGYTTILSTSGGVELEATNEALLFDPSTASFERVGRMIESRGFHEALPISDGRVMMVGGSRRMSVSYTEGSMFQIALSEAAQTAEVYDPEGRTFSLAGNDPLLARMAAAAVALPGDQIVLLGGQTALSRTNDIVLGLPSGTASWDWTSLSGRLAAQLRGSRAVLLDSRILLAGGNRDGDPPLEMGYAETLNFTPLSLTVSAYLSVSGHSLTESGDRQVLVAGGIPDFPGAPAVGDLTSLSFSGASPQAKELSLTHARAYHAAAAMADGVVLFAGGVDGSFDLRLDMETFNSGDQAPMSLDGTLSTGSVGLATALLPDGSVLLVGGLGLDPGGSLVLSAVAQILSP